MAPVVTLDIFSGRPNPSWPLGDVDARELARQLAALEPLARTESESAPALGYRGFQIMPAREKHHDAVRVYGGIVETPDGRFADPGRELERWLLQTAGGALEDSVRTYILSELKFQR